MPYGQVVTGPPGSGKTTYCHGLSQYLTLLSRSCHLINFDPGCDPTTFMSETVDVTFDIRKIVDLNNVMEKGWGPNGGLQWCFEYIAHNAEEVMRRVKESIIKKEREKIERIENISKEGKKGLEGFSDEEIFQACYLIVDFPGQVELYTHSESSSTILSHLTKPIQKGGHIGLNVVNVNLVDSTSIFDAGRFISTCLTTLMSCIRLSLPVVNVLTKVDLLRNQEAVFDIEFFASCDNLNPLLQYLEHGSVEESGEYADDKDFQKARQKVKDSIFYKRHKELTEGLVEVIEDYGLVNFKLLCVSDAALMGRVVAECDKVNGYVYTREEYATDDNKVNAMFKAAVKSDGFNGRQKELEDVRERYIMKNRVVENEEEDPNPKR